MLKQCYENNPLTLKSVLIVFSQYGLVVKTRQVPNSKRTQTAVLQIQTSRGLHINCSKPDHETWEQNVRQDVDFNLRGDCFHNMFWVSLSNLRKSIFWLLIASNEFWLNLVTLIEFNWIISTFLFFPTLVWPVQLLKDLLSRKNYIFVFFLPS